MPDAAAGRELPDETGLASGRGPGSGTSRRGTPRRGVLSGSGAVDEAAALNLLACGELDIKGRLVDASNATMYCTVSVNGVEAACVYKPVAGERPLWDFPEGTLAGREIAAYIVSRAAGWNVVPPTVYRDGPFGPGMCQLWIDADTSVDLLELARSNDERLRQMAVFDAVVNNADRKIGHLLPDFSGHLYGCDHGVCFGEEYKLRTVLWQWRGKKLPASAMAALGRIQHELVHGKLGHELTGWLSAAELTTTARRIETLIEQKVHPFPPSDWPAVPWPPI